MISKVEHWLQEIVLEAIKEHHKKSESHVTTIRSNRDPDPDDSEFNAGALWENTETDKTWKMKKEWKKLPKSRKKKIEQKHLVPPCADC